VVAARERGVTVCNVPAYGTSSVAQMTFALLIELTQHVDITRKRFATVAGANPLFLLLGFSADRVGWVGDGNCGLWSNWPGGGESREGFGMRVLARGERRSGFEAGVEFVELETLFTRSDVVSLHCPLTPETKHLVNAQRLGLMNHRIPA